MWKKFLSMFVVLVVLPLAAALCTPAGDEPVQVTLPVTASGSELRQPVTNAEGWTVTLSTFRLAIADIEFTIEGETHASLESRVGDWLIPSAHAHPGHYAGGEVTGELLGNFVLDLVGDDQPLGEGTLLTEDYNGANLHFRIADESDGLDADDPLLGHTAFIEGDASKGDQIVSFTVTIDVADGTEMVGAPFELTVTEETKGTIMLQVRTLDPSEGDTLFDGLDFGALDEDGDNIATIEPGSDAHNIFMKTLIRHDQYYAVFETQ